MFERIEKGSLLKNILSTKIGKVSDIEMKFALEQLERNKLAANSEDIGDITHLKTSITFYRERIEGLVG